MPGIKQVLIFKKSYYYFSCTFCNLESAISNPLLKVSDIFIRVLITEALVQREDAKHATIL